MKEGNGISWLQPMTCTSHCLPGASVWFCHHLVRRTGSNLVSALVLKFISFPPPGGLAKCASSALTESPQHSAEPAPLGCYLSLLPLPRAAEPEGAGMIPGMAKVLLGFASEQHKPQKAKRFSGSRARAALGQEQGCQLQCRVSGCFGLTQVYCIPRADGERLQNVVGGQVEIWAML